MVTAMGFTATEFLAIELKVVGQNMQQRLGLVGAGLDVNAIEFEIDQRITP